MKNWLRRKLRNFLNDDADCIAQPVRTRDSDSIESDNAFNLQIMSASGGTVIRAHKYDRRTDRTHNTLYIVRSEDDMAEQISRIIMTESLK